MKQIIHIVLFTAGTIFSAWPQCYVKNQAFQTGEKIHYQVYYNWGFLWIHAGEAFFEVGQSEIEGKEINNFKSYGKSLDSWDLFFKVRDYFQSYADDSLKPYKFVRNTYEGGYAVNNTYLFDHDNKRIYSFTENSKKPYIEDTLPLPPCTFDMQTAIYYVRNIDFTNASPGQKFPISMIIDNELVNLYVRYIGKDTIEARNGAVYKCIVFSALMMEGSIFKGGEDVKVWVTDDDNKIPVLVEAKIIVGYVKAYLSRASGLRHPSTVMLKPPEE